MRVLQLVSSSGFFGAENVILGLSQGLRRFDQDVLVGTFDNSQNPNRELRERAKESGLATRAFRCCGRFDLGTARAIMRCIRDEHVDLVHAHGYKADLYAYIAAWACSKPVVATCHNWVGSSRSMRFYERLDKLVLRRFASVVPVSSPVREKLQRAGVAPRRIVQINNGIDAERFAPRVPDGGLRASLGISVGDAVVGTVGRLAPLKGLEDLIEAAARVLPRRPHVTFLVVGAGPLLAQLSALARARGLEGRVVFTGVRPDVPELLALLDVFVLPSHAEGQPMALLEAMATARAVVATRVGDVPQILQGGELGALVPPADAEALAAAVLELLGDHERRAALGRQGRLEILKRYTVGRMATQYADLYRSCLAGDGESLLAVGGGR